MNFQKWVESKGGAAAVSRMLKLEAPRVRTWVRRGATPKPRDMQALVKLSKGQLSFDDIINSTSKPSKKKSVKKASAPKAKQ